MLSLLQAGSGARRPLLFCFYIGTYAHAALRAAFPTACIAIDTMSEPGPHPTARYTRLGSGALDGILSMKASIEWARSKAGDFEPSHVIAAGFSGGGQGVTTWLRGGEEPDAIVVADGWQTITPLALPAQMQRPGLLLERSRYVEKARRGERVLALSHTMITPPGYASTRRTAELLTGWSLSAAGALASPVRHEEGALLVESYAGDDAEAHGLQARVVFARLCAEAADRLDAFGLAHRSCSASPSAS